jgi:hypothetical protein
MTRESDGGPAPAKAGEENIIDADPNAEALGYSHSSASRTTESAGSEAPSQNKNAAT